MDLVVHLGGLMTALSSQAFQKINGRGTEYLATACAEMSSPPVFVFISSIAAAGTAIDGRPRNELDGVSPVSHYGQSKRSGELAAASVADRLPVTILRPPFVFGGGDRSGFYLFRPIKRFGIHPVPGMRHRRKISLIHAKDLADAILLVARRGTRVDPSDATEKSFRQGCYFICDDATPRYSQLGDMIGRRLEETMSSSYLCPTQSLVRPGGWRVLLRDYEDVRASFLLIKYEKGSLGVGFARPKKSSKSLIFVLRHRSSSDCRRL